MSEASEPCSSEASATVHCRERGTTTSDSCEASRPSGLYPGTLTGAAPFPTVSSRQRAARPPPPPERLGPGRVLLLGRDT